MLFWQIQGMMASYAQASERVFLRITLFGQKKTDRNKICLSVVAN